MSSSNNRNSNNAVRSVPYTLLTLAGIGVIVLVIASIFAWNAGWIGGRLTAQRLTNTIEQSGPLAPGFRRAHSKGVCVAGVFSPAVDAAKLSSARVFSQQQTPVIGRMSIGGGDPYGADAKARVRSMALLLQTDDGQQWRMAMNSFPFFAVPSVAAFEEQTLAQRPDPNTGKPDPAKMAAFAEKYPSAKRFHQWAMSAPWSTSWANTQYNGIHSFEFKASDGSKRYVRWSMLPQAAFAAMSEEQRNQADADYLSEELSARLAQGPVRWTMVVTESLPGDDINDPTQAWSDDHKHIVAGTLELTSLTPQAQGECRDINYDPTILPTGITVSKDPILAARSAVYSQSFNRRERETAHGVQAAEHKQ